MRSRVVRGRGRVRPTYALALPVAREATDLGGLIGLAFRAHRRALALTQRSYAVSRGWSKSHQWRLESAAGDLRLSHLDSALRGTGFRLMLVHEPGTPPQVLSGVPGAVLEQDFPDSEFVARDALGRRFPAHRAVRRPRVAPHWWTDRDATSRSFSPEWTTASGAVALIRAERPARPR